MLDLVEWIVAGLWKTHILKSAHLALSLAFSIIHLSLWFDSQPGSFSAGGITNVSGSKPISSGMSPERIAFFFILSICADIDGCEGWDCCEGFTCLTVDAAHCGDVANARAWGSWRGEGRLRGDGEWSSLRKRYARGADLRT